MFSNQLREDLKQSYKLKSLILNKLTKAITLIQK